MFHYRINLHSVQGHNKTDIWYEGFSSYLKTDIACGLCLQDTCTIWRNFNAKISVMFSWEHFICGKADTMKIQNT